MAATLQRELDVQLDEDDDDAAHYVCCLDEDTAFCGQDVRGAGWADGEAEICNACRLISSMSMEKGECPFGRECPE